MEALLEQIAADQGVPMGLLRQLLGDMHFGEREVLLSDFTVPEWEYGDFDTICTDLERSNRRSVCWKPLTEDTYIFICHTCNMGLGTVVFCDECFDPSRHEGHDVSRYLGGSGACDCGSELIDPSGCCAKHRPITAGQLKQIAMDCLEEDGFQYLAEYVRTLYETLLDAFVNAKHMTHDMVPFFRRMKKLFSVSEYAKVLMCDYMTEDDYDEIFINLCDINKRNIKEFRQFFIILLSNPVAIVNSIKPYFRFHLEASLHIMQNKHMPLRSILDSITIQYLHSEQMRDALRDPIFNIHLRVLLVVFYHNLLHEDDPVEPEYRREDQWEDWLTENENSSYHTTLSLLNKFQNSKTYLIKNFRIVLNYIHVLSEHKSWAQNFYYGTDNESIFIFTRVVDFFSIYLFDVFPAPFMETPPLTASSRFNFLIDLMQRHQGNLVTTCLLRLLKCWRKTPEAETPRKQLKQEVLNKYDLVAKTVEEIDFDRQLSNEQRFAIQQRLLAVSKEFIFTKDMMQKELFGILDERRSWPLMLVPHMVLLPLIPHMTTDYKRRFFRIVIHPILVYHHMMIDSTDEIMKFLRSEAVTYLNNFTVVESACTVAVPRTIMHLLLPSCIDLMLDAFDMLPSARSFLPLNMIMTTLTPQMFVENSLHFTRFFLSQMISMTKSTPLLLRLSSYNFEYTREDERTLGDLWNLEPHDVYGRAPCLELTDVSKAMCDFGAFIRNSAMDTIKHIERIAKGDSDLPDVQMDTELFDELVRIPLEKFVSDDYFNSISEHTINMVSLTAVFLMELHAEIEGIDATDKDNTRDISVLKRSLEEGYASLFRISLELVKYGTDVFDLLEIDAVLEHLDPMLIRTLHVNIVHLSEHFTFDHASVLARLPSLRKRGRSLFKANEETKDVQQLVSRQFDNDLEALLSQFPLEEMEEVAEADMNHEYINCVDELETCPICHEIMDLSYDKLIDNVVVILGSVTPVDCYGKILTSFRPCGHMMHLSCFRKHFRSHNDSATECPTCGRFSDCTLPLLPQFHAQSLSVMDHDLRHVRIDDREVDFNWSHIAYTDQTFRDATLRNEIDYGKVTKLLVDYFVDWVLREDPIKRREELILIVLQRAMQFHIAMFKNDFLELIDENNVLTLQDAIILSCLDEDITDLRVMVDHETRSRFKRFDFCTNIFDTECVAHAPPNLTVARLPNKELLPATWDLLLKDAKSFIERMGYDNNRLKDIYFCLHCQTFVDASLPKVLLGHAAVHTGACVFVHVQTGTVCFIRSRRCFCLHPFYLSEVFEYKVSTSQTLHLNEKWYDKMCELFYSDLEMTSNHRSVFLTVDLSGNYRLGDMLNSHY
ncbi:hypothetical protein PCE1_004692 [Barthelona sp. PCE]